MSGGFAQGGILRVKRFVGCKETYTVTQTHDYAMYLAGHVRLRDLIGRLRRDETGELRWCEWHDADIGDRLLLYTKDQGMLGGLVGERSEADEVLDMLVQDVFSISASLEYQGYVEVRTWKGQRWGSEARIF